MTWDGATPRHACEASEATNGEAWECSADLVGLGAPPGDLTFYFDVNFDASDPADAVSHSPDGSRTVSFASPPAAGWSKPRLVDRADCAAAAAGIDAGSRYHIAASCGGSIRYSVSKADGSWSTTMISRPSNREDRDPQIAFDGAVAYVAYSQVALTEGGCGDDGSRDVGVYYRQRILPDGGWSDAIRLGEVDDRLQAFRVDRGTLHATVRATDGHVYYEMQNGDVFHRYLVADAVGATSLRVGSDGMARIAYVGKDSLRYATSTGSRLSLVSITGSAAAEAPVLVLGKGNLPHLLWTVNDWQEGDCGPILGPLAATYYATLTNGKWVSARITSRVGPTSLTLDVDTGRVHAVIGGSGILYYTKATTGDWTWTTLTPAGAWVEPLIRLDPRTGTLLVVYVAKVNDGVTGDVYVITKP